MRFDLKKILLFIVTYVSLSSAYSQLNFIPNQIVSKKLDCACLDSAGRLVKISTLTDTTFVYRYDSSSQTWSFITSVNIGASSNVNKLSCQYGPQNILYVSGLYDNGLGKHVMYAYKQGNWVNYADLYDSQFNSPNTVRMQLEKVRAKVYLVNDIDSISGVNRSHIYEVNSGGLNSLNFQSNSSDQLLTALNDTLYMSSDAKLYRYLNSSWTVVYKLPVSGSIYISGLASLNNKIYIAQSNGVIRTYSYGSIDSVTTFLSRPKLDAVQNRIIISPREAVSDNFILYSMTSLSNVQTNLRLKNYDTFGVKILPYAAKSYIYYKNNLNVASNKINYNQIAEITHSQLSNQSYDTLIFMPFLDHNGNGRKDLTDTFVDITVQDLYGNIQIPVVAGGKNKYMALKNEDICFTAPQRVSYDSCYELSFDGGLCSRHYQSGIALDTLWFPYIVKKPGGQRNVKVKVYPSGLARLDDDIPVNIRLRRNDCDNSSVSGQLLIDIPNGASLVSTSPPYKSFANNQITYDFTIADQEEQNFLITVKYPSTKFSLNQKSAITATIANTTNEYQLDNKDSAVHRCVYSYDPNAKICIPDGRIKYGLKEIKFHIDFQNEGNDLARRVVIVDTINLKMPVYEFKMIGSSHTYRTSHNDNVVTWTFDDINLTPKDVSETDSKGYIEFEAKVSSELRVGDSIINNATIYFDNNEPIYTNTSMVKRVTGFKSIFTSKLLSIYPNPAQDELTVVNKSDEDMEIEIYDSRGVLVGTASIYAVGENHIDISGLSSGLYLLQVQGKGTCMLIKE